MRRKRLAGSLTSIRAIEDRIVTIRGLRVMADKDLSALYGVTTKVLNQAVARNPSRFPADFAFRITPNEAANLKSQIVTSSSHGGRRKPVRVFTEQGVAMLSSVLRSPRAVAVNVAIMRAFVRLRALALTHAELTRRIDELEKRFDHKFAIVFRAIRDATSDADEPPRPQVGFITSSSSAKARARARRRLTAR